MICTLLRKPLNGGGILSTLPCAAMNLDACRVGTSKSIPGSPNSKKGQTAVLGKYGASSLDHSGQNPNIGRFPANLIIRSDPALLQWFLAEFGLTQEGVARREKVVQGSVHVLGGMGNHPPGTPDSPRYGTTPGSVVRYFKRVVI